MTLLDSLLDAIIRLQGESLVMHVGERPYVVTSSKALDSFRGPLSWGQVELSSRPLTPDAVLTMLGQILPPDQRLALDEIGAIEHEIGSPGSDHRFIVVAARGGDDVWVEVRRKPEPVPEAPAVDAPPEPPAVEAAAEPAPVFVGQPEIAAQAEPIPVAEAGAAEAQPAVLNASGTVVETPIVLVPEEVAEVPTVVEGDTLVSLGEVPVEEFTLALDVDMPGPVVIDETPEIIELDDAEQAGEWFSLSVPTKREAATAAPPEPESEDLTAVERLAQAEAKRLEEETLHIATLAADVLIQGKDAFAAVEQPAAAEQPDTIVQLGSPEPFVGEAEAASVVPEPVPVAAAPVEESVLAVEPEQVLAAEPEPTLAAEPEPVLAVQPEPVLAVEPEPALAVEPEPVTLAAEPVAEPVPVAEAPVEEPVLAVEPVPVLTAQPEPAVAAEPEPVLSTEPEPVLATDPEPLIFATEETIVEPAAPLAPQPDVAAGMPAAEPESPSVEVPVVAPSQEAIAVETPAVEMPAAAMTEPSEAAVAQALAGNTTAQADVPAARESAASAPPLAAIADAVIQLEPRVPVDSAAFALRARAIAAERTAAPAPPAPVAPHAEAPPPAAPVEAPSLAEVQRAPEVQPVAEVQPAGVVATPRPPRVVEEPEDLFRPIVRLQPKDAPPSHGVTAAVVDVLRHAFERGASTVYAIGGSRPLMRVEGDITSSASLPVLQPGDIDRFAFEYAPRDEVAAITSEWTTQVAGVGRIRCVSFEDEMGRGLVLHLAANVSSADELSLSREVQALCHEADGLVVVAGPRASGKSTLLHAFIDRINRSRADHVITIESRLRTLHERRHSLISQREVDGDGETVARAARAALREGPDVLVVDDVRSPEAIAVAIDAARAGRLVFVSMPAPNATAALERLTDAFAVDRRPQVRALLSGALRAVISQVLVHKIAGGRTAAREVLLSSPAVSKLILDGAIAQMPIAIQSGRRLGMRTMTDALVSLVREGVIDAAEAGRNAPDRRILIAALRQEGIDVSELERWA